MNNVFQTTLIIAGLLFTNISSAVTYSGTINMPVGVTVGAAGAEFEVFTRFSESFLDDGGNLQQSSDVAVFPPFGASASFSFELPPNPEYNTHNILFECDTGCEFIDATLFGVWSDINGIVTGFDDATNYSSAENQTINIQLEAENRDRFSGVIQLPDGLDSPNTIVYLSLQSGSGISFEVYGDFFTAESGETELPFVISVPSSSNSSNWTLSFTCSLCNENIEPEKHFVTTITGNPTTLNENEQYFFSKGNDYDNITVTFISLLPPRPPTIMAPIILLLDQEGE